MGSDGGEVGSDSVGDNGGGDGGGGGSYTVGLYWQWVVLVEGNNSSNKLRQ